MSTIAENIVSVALGGVMATFLLWLLATLT